MLTDEGRHGYIMLNISVSVCSNGFFLLELERTHYKILKLSEIRGGRPS